MTRGGPERTVSASDPPRRGGSSAPDQHHHTRAKLGFARAGARGWWERCRYDRSQPGVVTATVIDSNVYHPELSGFVWRARPHDGFGSEVEMTIYRRFRLTPKGLAAATLYKLARSWWLGGMQRQVLRAIESEASGG